MYFQHDQYLYIHQVVECGSSRAAGESLQRDLEEQVARLRMRNETLELRLQAHTNTYTNANTKSGTDTGATDRQGQGLEGDGGQGEGPGRGDVLVEDGTLAFLQAKTTLIVQQESQIARLTTELEAARRQASDRVQVTDCLIPLGPITIYESLLPHPCNIYLLTTA